MSNAFWDRLVGRRRPRPDPPVVVPPEPTPADPVPPPILNGGSMRVLPVTGPEDGELVNRMYSYWPNAWVSGATIDVFVGHADGQVRFFSVELATGAVTRLGALLPYGGTGEGWFWDAEGWIYLCDGPRLRRVNPFTKEDRVVFDISETHPGCDLWQAHSSDSGDVHSATVRQIVSDGQYPKFGTIVKHPGGVVYFPARGVLDESQISRNGRWLVIKEDDDNRIIDLWTTNERVLTDAAGALGHSDLGDNFAVGEDNQQGACVYLDLATLESRPLFSTWNMGYVSVRGGRCLHSGDTHINLVALDGSSMTPLVEHGGGSSYDERVKSNLDPTGRVGCYMARGVVYLLVLP